jgi:DNA-binding transcriptional regulator YiaG
MTPEQITRLRLNYKDQPALAKAMGVSLRTVKRWEAGEKAPTKAETFLLKHLAKRKNISK